MEEHFSNPECIETEFFDPTASSHAEKEKGKIVFFHPRCKKTIFLSLIFLRCKRDQKDLRPTFFPCFHFLLFSSSLALLSSLNFCRQGCHVTNIKMCAVMFALILISASAPGARPRFLRWLLIFFLVSLLTPFDSKAKKAAFKAAEGFLAWLAFHPSFPVRQKSEKTFGCEWQTPENYFPPKNSFNRKRIFYYIIFFALRGTFLRGGLTTRFLRQF